MALTTNRGQEEGIRFEVAGQIMTAEEHLSFMKDLFPHDPEIIEAYKKKIAKLTQPPKAKPTRLLFDVPGERIDCQSIGLKPLQAQLPIIEMEFLVDGELVKKAITPTGLWAAINIYYQFFTTSLKNQSSG